MLNDTKQPAEPAAKPPNFANDAAYYEGKARQYERQRVMKELAKKNRAEEKAQREAEKKLKAEQQVMYPKLTPQEWKDKYGSDKPKIGLIDHDTAVRMISRRMTSVALHTLADICQNSKNDGARVSAAREILDRGWGKAHLEPEGETKPGAEITVVFGNQQAMDNVIEAEPEGDDDDDELDEDSDADAAEG